MSRADVSVRYLGPTLIAHLTLMAIKAIDSSSVFFTGFYQCLVIFICFFSFVFFFLSRFHRGPGCLRRNVPIPSHGINNNNNNNNSNNHNNGESKVGRAEPHRPDRPTDASRTIKQDAVGAVSAAVPRRRRHHLIIASKPEPIIRFLKKNR